MQGFELNRFRRLAGPLAFLLAIIGMLGLEAGEPAVNKKFPNQILIIRHAEKPDDKTKTGLSDKGKKRAAALHELFEKSATRKHPFPVPDFIFATMSSKKSTRPVDTITPSATLLNRKPLFNDSFDNHKEGMDGLVEALLNKNPTPYAGKTILICWHHGTIPELAQKLVKKVSKHDEAVLKKIPQHWPDPDHVFDQVWQITCQGTIDFQISGQHLMPWDKSK